MFADNKYTRIYYQLIQKRTNEVLSKNNVYCESHHIIPKSLGGSNDESNLINLLPREHFIAHLLLTKMVSDKSHIIKMHWALHRMCYSSIDYFNSKDYEWYRKRHIIFLKDNHPSKTVPGWNQKIRELVTSSWENADDRRKKTSDRMRDQWSGPNREILLEHNRKNAKLGAQAAKIVLSKKLEYMGKEYIGWKDLLDSTGISKFLYKKFYLKGYDPSDRIGQNGPLPKNYVYKPLDKKENP
jgi:hypothetical protein